MKNLKGALIFAQSGGPTAVINASACGVFTEALKNPLITAVYAAEHGIKGVLDEDLIDIAKEDPAEIKLMKTTPSSAIGSVRYKLKNPDSEDGDYKKLLNIFKKYNVRYFLYNGGNDSMDTANKISEYMSKSGYEINVVGVPKTIDNDLMGTDHCPGYGSAAKYIATTVSELVLDLKVYNTGIVCIIEVMGRDAGWLTASAVLAARTGYGADLIYLPERPFSNEQFIKDVKNTMKRNGDKCIAVVSEGIRYADGSLVGASQAAVNDGFNHAQLGGVCNILKDIISKEVSVKVRAVELSLMQRCAGHLASKTDVEEAYKSGVHAVKAATSGKSGVMVALKRASGEKYAVRYVSAPLSLAANNARSVPQEWINEEGNNVTDELVEYMLPLICGESTPPFKSGVPCYAELKKIKVKID